jgi:D-inositol-3-phosphate glycosyltransferase
MKAVFYNGMPSDIETEKNAAPKRVTLMGSSIYLAEVLPALLRYGTFDRYYLPAAPLEVRDQVFSTPYIFSNLHRIGFIEEHMLHALQTPDELVFMSTGPLLRELAAVRSRLNRPGAPITGVLHSLNYNSATDFLLLEMLSNIKSFDALFTGSSAGLVAFDRWINSTQQLYRDRFDLHLEFRPKLLQVPSVGVTSEIFSSVSYEIINRMRASLSLEQDAVALLYFGRFSSRSKADLYPLILAFSRLPYVEHKLVLVLAGDDTQMNLATNLFDFAHDLGCSSHLRIIPNPSKKDKLSLYRASNIFISLSDSAQETYGITLIEAMAASLPVIASDWDGYRDIVVHGKTGFLIPTLLPDYSSDFDLLHSSGHMTSDDLLARTTIVDIPNLSQTIMHLILNPTLRRDLGRNGYKRVIDLYDWRQVIKRYEDAWSELIIEGNTLDRKSGQANLDSYREFYSYKEVFGHYATRYLSENDSLEVDESASSVSFEVLQKIAIPKERFDVDIFSRIIDKVRHVHGICVGDVINVIDVSSNVIQLQPLSNKMIVLIHLTRLLKYGLIRINVSNGVSRLY